MYTVIRNGKYLHTEKFIIGDIEVSPKPHENALFINDEWVIDADCFFAKTESTEALEFLNATDWQITRHKEEQDLEIETTLSNEEYLALITKRQLLRRKV